MSIIKIFDPFNGKQGDWIEVIKRVVIQEEDVKFVVFKHQEQHVAYLYPACASQHILLARQFEQKNQGSDFVGAGLVDIHGVTWGSMTCTKAYGYDQPKDNKVREELLQQIEQLLKA